MANQKPRTWASVAALRIVQAPAQQAQPVRKVSDTKSAENTTESAGSDIEHGHNTATTNSENVQVPNRNKKRQKKRGNKKTKETIAEDARTQGVIVIPGTKSQETDDTVEPHPGWTENCDCMYCKCKLCAGSAEPTLCEGRCVICKKVRQLLHNEETQLNAAYNKQVSSLLLHSLLYSVLILRRLKISHKQ
jgi:hypothetical protein